MGTDTGLLHVLYEAIMWTDAYVNWTLTNELLWFFHGNEFFIHKNVSKMMFT